MKKYNFEAVIFDLDGVITKTALVHSRAWKKMFDKFLKKWSDENNIPFDEFQTQDYLDYVDGKPRYEGVKSFLDSRNINIDFGTPDDDPENVTVCGLGNRKNYAFNQILNDEGAEAYSSTVALMEELKKNNIRIGVASSSKNCQVVLQSTGLEHYVETRVDGVVSAEIGLKGKPEPDIFVKAAHNLNVSIDKSVVVEDASSGVEAGKKGNFGLVIGLARENNQKDLWSKGADVVVEDLEEFGMDKIEEWFENGLEEDNWSLSYRDYVPGKEKTRETLLSIGNGFFGTRGALPFTEANENNYPGTYIAGFYNRLVSKVGDKDIENEDFVNCPNWLSFRFKINNSDWIDINQVEIISVKRYLDFRSGLYTADLIIMDNGDRKTKITVSRFASMENPHLAAQRISLTPVNYSGNITIESGINGDIINDGVARYRQLSQNHLIIEKTGEENGSIYLLAKTTQSKIGIALAAKHLISVSDNQDSVNKSESSIYKTFTVCLNEGNKVILNKFVSIYTTHTYDTYNPKTEALNLIDKELNFESLLSQSKEQWSNIWDKVDIKIEGDRLAQKLLRLHLYHLMVSLSPHNKDLDASITARGLHGEAYRGHIFWDELFILPLYNIQLPDISKSALMYRYHRLVKARKYAKDNGFSGAMFPWQSGSDGREETQVLHLNPVSGNWGPDFSSYQRHVSLAIAYNIWRYFHVTQDKDFMVEFGAEMFLEICRFWASKAKFDPVSQRYSISQVMGPDEFHEKYKNTEEGGLKDNAYTNLMVVWTLSRAFDIIRLLNPVEKKAVFGKINLSTDEIELWENITSKINLVIKDDIISQYDGYFDLQELDWDLYREKYSNIYRMDRLLKAEGKSADDYKVAKQADTLQTFYNLDEKDVTKILNDLDYQLSDNFLEKNLKYYLERTSHGSTLSRVVHAQLANMINDKDLSWKLYKDALTSDYADIQGGTTGEGIHAGVMAGTVLIALQSFAGINVKGDILSFEPHLPDHWRKIEFGFTFKGVNYKCQVASETLSVVTKNAYDDVKIIVNGREQLVINEIENIFVLNN